MSVDSMDALKSNYEVMIGQETDEELQRTLTKLDLVVSLLSIAMVDDNREMLEEAVGLFDEILFELRSRVPSEASQIIGYPLVDALELMDCIGADAVYEILAYAIGTLYLAPVEAPTKLIDVYSDCLGWASDPSTLPPTIIAGGVVASFTAALNKTLLSKQLT